MNKKILLISLFLFVIPIFSYAYTISNVIFKSDDNIFSLKIKNNDNVEIKKIDYYDYGVNVLIKNIAFDKIYLKKINSKLVNNVKIIPINKNLTLLKIQTNSEFDKNKFKIDKNNGYLVLTYGNSTAAIQLSKNEKMEKNLPSKTDEEDKIIEELTKKPFEENINIIPKKEPKTQTIQPVPAKKEAKNNKTIDLKKEFNFTDKIIKTYSLLGVMCIFLLGLSFAIKRFKNRKIMFNDNQIFKVVYKYEISPKKSLAIIKVYNEYLLVGITEYNINLIAKIESEDIKNEIKLIEGEREKNKFIKYLKEQDREEEKRSEKIDKDLLISSIEEKIRRYKKLIS